MTWWASPEFELSPLTALGCNGGWATAQNKLFCKYQQNCKEMGIVTNFLQFGKSSKGE